jgi:hypothetical protein
MATTIITKNGSGAPAAGDLVQGELAVDLTNQTLYSKDSSGNVFKVGDTGGGSPGTFTDLVATDSFTSPGIDDNATSTAITIDSGQDVGIGTDDPRQKLVVSSSDNGFEFDPNASTGNRLLSYSRASGQYSDMNIKASTFQIDTGATGTTSAMTIDASGNVGIGAAPDTTGFGGTFKYLGLNGGSGNGAFNGQTTSTTVNSVAAQYMGSTTGTSGYQILGGMHVANGASSAANAEGALVFYTATGGSLAERMRIDDSGNVGIGTDDPNRTLTVSSASGVPAELISSSTNSLLAFFDANTGVRPSLGSDGSDLVFNASGERMRIDSTGNVGIGTTNPAASIDVNTTAQAPSPSTFNGMLVGQESGTMAVGSGVGLGFKMRNSSGGSVGGNSVGAAIYGVQATAGVNQGELTFHTRQDNLSLDERMRIDATGNVLVGTTSAMAQGGGGPLSVYSTAGSQLILGKSSGAPSISFGSTTTQYGLMEGQSGGGFKWYTGNGSMVTRMTLDNSGNLTATGNVTAYSDERLKDNVETLDGSKVYDMRGVSFTKDGEAGSGVIAQELQMVAPELVHEGEEYLSVAYGNLVGYLIEAVKDLKAEVEELKRAK